MFKFNAAAVSFGQNLCLGEALACFETVPPTEECDVLELRISSVAKEIVNFGEKQVLRARLTVVRFPLVWSMNHEIVWSSMWE